MSSGWLINLLIFVAILAIVCVAAWFILSQIEMTEPIRKIVMIVAVAVVAIIAIILLLQLGGGAKLGRLSYGEARYANLTPLRTAANW